MQDNVCHVIMQKAETFHSYEYLPSQTWTYVAADTINGQGQIAMLSRCRSEGPAYRPDAVAAEKLHE